MSTTDTDMTLTMLMLFLDCNQVMEDGFTGPKMMCQSDSLLLSRITPLLSSSMFKGWQLKLSPPNRIKNSARTRSGVTFCIFSPFVRSGEKIGKAIVQVGVDCYQFHNLVS